MLRHPLTLRNFVSSKFSILKLLNKRQIRKFIFITLCQTILGVLDVLAVLIVGILGVIAISGINSTYKSEKATQVLNFFELGDLSLQNQTILLAALVFALLIFKTLASAKVAKVNITHLSNSSVAASTRLVRRYFSGEALGIRTDASQLSIYSLTEGVDKLVISGLGAIASIICDISLLIFLVITLMVVDIKTTTSMIIIFGLMVFAIDKAQSRATKLKSQKLTTIKMEVKESLFSLGNSIREIRLRNSYHYFDQKLERLRIDQAVTNSILMNQPNISKSAADIGIVVVACVIGAIQFLSRDAAHAIASLGIFLTAGTRTVPAILRVQSNMNLLRSILHSNRKTLIMNDTLPEAGVVTVLKEKTPDTFLPILECSNLSFRYQDSEKLIFSNLNFVIRAGEKVAITGVSGVGKSTLVDLIMGFINPLSGEIRISGILAEKVPIIYPGKLGYVPQNITITKESLFENVVMGYESAEDLEAKCNEILIKLGLEEFLMSLEHGIHSNLGEYGSRLSGGQRQRIGLARALITSPEFLILDEATSALDEVSEQLVNKSISELGSQVTVISITHKRERLSRADKIINLEKGNFKILTHPYLEM